MTCATKTRRYSIDLNLLNSLEGCKKAFQRGNSYCALGKLGVAATGKRQIAYYDFYNSDLLECDEEFHNFLTYLQTELGRDALRYIMDMNDAKGPMDETHEKALAKIVDILKEKKLVDFK